MSGKRDGVQEASKIESGSMSRQGENFSEIWNPYLHLLTRIKSDTNYGPYFESDGTDQYPALKLGDKILDMRTNGREFTVGDRTFDVTPGLLALMFEKKPDLTNVTDSELETYLDLLDFTNALYRDNDRNKGVKATNFHKYQKVIKPVLEKRNAMERARQTNPLLKRDKGFLRFGKPPAYQYWRDPNALVSRLALLKASKRAGNASHDAEAREIENELRDANLILARRR